MNRSSLLPGCPSPSDSRHRASLLPALWAGAARQCSAATVYLFGLVARPATSIRAWLQRDPEVSVPGKGCSRRLKMGSTAPLPHRETLSISAVKPCTAERLWPVLQPLPSEPWPRWGGGRCWRSTVGSFARGRCLPSPPEPHTLLAGQSHEVRGPLSCWRWWHPHWPQGSAHCEEPASSSPWAALDV